jgi:type I restriction enzyme, S subunit
MSTGLYDIPNDWFSAKLRNMTEDLQTGFASGERDDNGIIQLRMNNITDDGRFNFEELLKVPIPSDIERFDLQTDDIIFNNTNSLDLIGKTAIVSKRLPYTFSNHLTRIRVIKNKLVPHWLYFILLRYKERFVFRAVCHTHVGQSGIGKNELQNLQIFFPSVVEQQKITSILSKLDELIQKTDQVIKQTQRLKKGLMQRLLTKGIGHEKLKKTTIGEIPEEWEIVKLYEISSDFIGGGTPSTSNPDYWNGSIPWMRSAWIRDHYISSAEKYITKLGLENSATHIVPTNNVLIATRVSIGNVAVNKIDIAISQDLTGVVIDKSRADEEYVYWYFLNSKDMIISLVQGSTIKGLTRDDLENFYIPKPSLTEQKKIASILLNADYSIWKLYDHRLSLEFLKKGLMQKLLTGKIRVKVQ